MRLLARLVVSVLAGVAAGLSFEPYHLVVLLPVSVAAITLAARGTRLRAGFALGVCFGITFMLVLLPWLQVIGPAAWVALAVIEGLFYGLVGLGGSVVTRLPGWPLWAATGWVLVELARSTVPFGGFPWGRLGYAVADTPVAPLFGYAGPAGATFAVALVGTVLAWAVLRVRRTPVRALGTLLVTCVAVSAASFFPVSTAVSTGDGDSGGDSGAAGSSADTVTVAAVQGNVPGVGLDAFAERRAVLNNHVRATLELADRIVAGAAQRPDLVVWPENSSDIDPYRDSSARAAISAAVRAVGVPLLMGAVVDGEPGTGWHNRAIVWSADGFPRAFYDKIHPVPFGEYVPLRSLLAGWIPALDQIPVDMARGDTPGVLDVGPAKVGVLMCFEVAYDDLVHDVVAGGARMIVVPTNNATYTGTGQIRQQFAMSRLRAIETGRTVVVASTNGISGIIAPDGEVVARAPVQTQAVLEQEVVLRDAVTPAVRFGAWIERLLALAGVVSIVVGIVLSRRRRRTARPAVPEPQPAPTAVPAP